MKGEKETNTIDWTQAIDRFSDTIFLVTDIIVIMAHWYYRVREAVKKKNCEKAVRLPTWVDPPPPSPEAVRKMWKKINFSFWLWFMVKYDLKRVLPKKKKITTDTPPNPPPCASVLKKSGICHNFQAHDCFFTDFFWTLPFQKLCMWIANVPLCKTQPEQIFTPKRCSPLKNIHPWKIFTPGNIHPLKMFTLKIFRWTAGCRHCRTRSKLCMTSCCSTVGT